jgi:hypothetical protein
MHYIVDNKKITLEEAEALANEFGTTVEELALSGGWKQVEEGKTTVPEETTPPTEPVKTTAAGDSSLADTSLESQEIPEFNPKSLKPPKKAPEGDPYMGFYADGTAAFDDDIDINKTKIQEEPNPRLDRFAQNVAEYAKKNSGIMPFSIDEKYGTRMQFGEFEGATSDPYMSQTQINLTNGKSIIVPSIDPNNIQEKTNDDVYGVKSWGGTPTTTEEDINFEIEEAQLNLPSKSQYIQYNEEGTYDFVAKYYDATQLEAIGINLVDFQGWLNKNGLAEDFEQDVKDGLYNDGLMATNYSDAEDTSVALEELKQKTLRGFLDTYIDSDIEHTSKKSFIDFYNSNKEKFNESVGFDGAYKLYTKINNRPGENYILNAVKGSYKLNEFDAYRKAAFPAAVNADLRIERKIEEDYAEKLNRNEFEKFIDPFKQFVVDAFIGLEGAGLETVRYMQDRVMDTVGDFTGLTTNVSARQDRLLWDKYQQERVNNQLGYVSTDKGDVVYYKDRKFIVQDDGQIFDTEAELNVTSILDSKQLKEINDLALQSTERDYDISTRGGLGAAGAVIGNIGWQILLTRATGQLRMAASEKYIASINNFKNVKSLRKYMTATNKAGNRRGMNWKGISADTYGQFGIKLPFNAAMVDATVFQTFYGASIGYENTYSAARKAGLTDKEAEALAIEASKQMAVLYAGTGPINPRIKALNKLDDFLTKSNATNRAVADFIRSDKKLEAFRSSLTASVGKGAKFIKNFSGEGTKEVVQENIQQAGETLFVNKNINRLAKKEILDAEYSLKDFMETTALSFITAGAIGSVNIRNIGYKGNEEKRFENLYLMSQDIKSSTALLNTMVEAGRITKEDAKTLISQAKAVANQEVNIPKWMRNQGVDAVEVAVLLEEREQAEKAKKNSNPVTHGPLDAKIEEIDSKIENLIKDAAAKQTEKEASIVQQILGVDKVKVFNTIEEMVEAGIDRKIAENVDGFVEVDGQIYINLEVASKNLAISVGSHELLHRVLYAELKSNPNKEAIINQLRDAIIAGGNTEIEKRIRAAVNFRNNELKKLQDQYKKGEITKKQFNKLKNNIAGYDIVFNEDGTVSGKDIDEYITAFSDALAKEEISMSEPLLLEIGRWISTQIKAALGIDKQFETGKDVLKFVKDYQKSIKKGKLSGAAKLKLKASEKALSEQTDSGQPGKRSFSVSTKKELFNVIKDVQPKNAKTKSEFQSDPGFTDLYMLMQPGQPIHNFIVSKFPGQTEKVRGLIESLEERLINFDPEKKRKGSNEVIGAEGFVEFLMANINFAALDINKKLAKEAAIEKQTGSLDSETAKQVADISNEIKKELAKRPEYKDLLRRRVVDEDVIKDIEQKVTKIVALLKSRIDAKVSNNVTVTPLIREIKKEAGKSIDIDFKKAMGGKKDGELRKFLLRNKAAILENMSTTWLSQAIPNAIQKSVDGVFTTDWKGKKIDRETMETDLAGRTSGADLVRRLPKAPGAISDSDFLSAFLEPNGNPTRGKKESLAKAMAEEITFDIIKKSFDENGPIAKAFIENQKRNGVENAENMGPEFKRQAERGNVKFSFTAPISEGRPSAVRVLNEADIMATLQLLDSAAGDSRVLKEQLVQTALTKILKDNGYGNKLFDLSDPKQLETYTQTIKEFVVPIMGRDFWGTEKATHLLHSKEIMFGGKIKKRLKELEDDPTKQQKEKEKFIEEFEAARDKFIEDIFNDSSQKYGKKIANPKKFKNPQTGRTIDTTPFNVFQNEEIAQAAYEDGAVLSYNIWTEKTGKQLWFGLKNVLQQNKDNPNVAIAIATWLSSSASNTKHPMRELASMIGYSKGFDKKVSPIEIEHALPATAMIQTLFNTALQNPEDFATNYSYVSKNYVLIGMNKSDENKTKSFKKTNIKSYNLRSGTWWDRYLNPITAKAQGYLGKGDNKKFIDGDFGIDSKSIILFSGNSLYEVAGVRKNGSFLSDFEIGAQKIKLKKGKKYFKLKDIAKVAAKDKVELDRFRDGQRKYSASFPEPSALNAQFNAILRRKSGIDGRTEISRTRAQILGKDKGRFKFFIAPGADDFRGLVHYAFAGQGKQGEKDMEFFEKNLMDPYFKGIAAIDAMRQLIKREFKVVTTEFKDEYAMLSESVPGTPFTYDHAVRVYMWGLAGTNIPGLSDKDRNDLENAILDNPALADFAEALLIVGRRETWPDPSEFWIGDSVLSDLNSMTEKVGRKEILAQFITNVDAIFDEGALNKVEAIKGRKHREALEDAIYAMKNGSNRPSGANIQTNKWINWINGSTGAIMFFNRRSALLQMLSFTNFINWSDNNPIKAAAAFANQKQYWKDFVFIFNSDKLKERRGGLKQDVSESEIAQVAGRSKNSPQAILAYMLKLGFTPTQIADSMAIATGGATFYRNRINTYLKQGMPQKKAEEKAFEDFSKASDIAQQSSDPALVSQQQRSILGRFILAFANTPMQYTRLMKKAGQDLINGRGDAKEHISKILYYGFIQNFIFSALQSAMFGLFFDDEEDDETRKKNADKKLLKTVNSMVDTILRGSGIYGAIVSTIKNTIQQYYIQEGKGFMADHGYTLLSAFNISPPIGSKFRKLYTAIKTRKFEKDAIAARGWAITAGGRVNLGPNWAILGSLVSGVANVPLDRVYDEINSISEALDARNKAWQRIALALGWKTWDVGVKNEEHDLIETLAKEKRKEEGIKKAAETRRKKKEKREIKDAGDF